MKLISTETVEEGSELKLSALINFVKIRVGSGVPFSRAVMFRSPFVYKTIAASPVSFEPGLYEGRNVYVVKLRGASPGKFFPRIQFFKFFRY